jgi:hypothetical protein
MAKAGAAQFSGQNLNLEEIARHHNDVESSVRLFFSSSSPFLDERFTGYSLQEISSEMSRIILEHERDSALKILASIEAVLRLDYLQRCDGLRKDLLSRELKKVFNKKRDKARLDDDIIGAWKKYSGINPEIFHELIAAFNYRHWLAHGRYWIPKLGRQKYDFTYLYILAESFFMGFIPLRVDSLSITGANGRRS